jgi:hypothetical protein
MAFSQEGRLKRRQIIAELTEEKCSKATRDMGGTVLTGLLINKRAC